MSIWLKVLLMRSGHNVFALTYIILSGLLWSLRGAYIPRNSSKMFVNNHLAISLGTSILAAHSQKSFSGTNSKDAANAMPGKASTFLLDKQHNVRKQSSGNKPSALRYRRHIQKIHFRAQTAEMQQIPCQEKSVHFF